MTDTTQINRTTTAHQAQANVFESMRPREFSAVATTTDSWAELVHQEGVMGAGSIGVHVANSGPNSIDVRLAYQGRDNTKVSGFVAAGGDESALTLAAGEEGYLWALVKLPDVAVQIKASAPGLQGRVTAIGGVA